MNLNLVSYSIYLPISAGIIIWLGKTLHQSGYYYVLEATNLNKPLATSINNTLLLGYYLVNMGYAVTSLINWKAIDSATFMLVELIDKTGWLIITIGLMHYLNILALKMYRSTIL